MSLVLSWAPCPFHLEACWRLGNTQITVVQVAGQHMTNSNLLAPFTLGCILTKTSGDARFLGTPEASRRLVGLQVPGEAPGIPEVAVLALQLFEQEEVLFGLPQ